MIKYHTQMANKVFVYEGTSFADAYFAFKKHGAFQILRTFNGGYRTVIVQSEYVNPSASP